MDSQTPITLEQAEKFVKQIEKQLATGNSEPFVRAVDWSLLTDRVLEGIPEKDSQRFDRRYLIRLFAEKGGLAQSVAQKVKDGGSYHFLRMRKLDLQTFVATFRLIDVEGGLDYHDLFLIQRGKNLVQIADFYLYHFGETFSETLRRTLVPELYVQGVNDYGMAMGEQVLILFRENTGLIQELSRAFEAQDAERTLNLFEQLPRDLKQLKTFQFWRLKAAQAHSDPGVYRYVLAEVRQYFASEAWVDFLSLDYFFARGEFENALACLDRIDARVGGDPYLESFRCWAYLNLKKPADAQKHLETALQKEPALSENPSFVSLKTRLKQMRIRPLNPFEGKI